MSAVRGIQRPIRPQVVLSPERLAALRPYILMAGVTLAVCAQSLADRRAPAPIALALFLLAGVLYALAARPSTAERPTLGQTTLVVNRTLFPWALVFGLLAWAGFRPNQITLQGLMPWVLAVWLCYWALSAQPATAPRAPWLARLRAFWRQGAWRVSWPTVGLWLAVALGAWLRFHRLAELPADLGWDLPFNLTDAQRILHESYLVFFPDNLGREGLFFYLMAGVSRVFGLSPYSMRLTSALVGVAAIPAVYLLARELTNREVGAYAALLLAVNKWHIVLTRSGYRVSLMPLFAILVLYGLARGLRRGRARDWFWCGLFLGLGLLTYKAFVFAVPVVVGSVLVYMLPGLRRVAVGESARWGERPALLLRGLGLALMVAVIVAMPLLRFLFHAPETYFAREQHGLQLVSESLEGQPTRWEVLGQNTITSLLMFNYEGDGNSRFGVPFQRHLGFVSGALFVLGGAGALARLRRGGNALLLLALGGLLLPMTVSLLAGEKPNCFRSSGTIGPAVLMGALALAALRHALGQLAAKAPPLLVRLVWNGQAEHARRSYSLQLGARAMVLPFLLVGLLIGYEERETVRFYFQDFRRFAPDVANYSIAQEVAHKVAAFDEGPAYIKVWPHWYDGRAVRAYLVGMGITWDNELFELDQNSGPLRDFRGKILVILNPEDTNSLQLLQNYFPRWTVNRDTFPDGRTAMLAFYGQR
ncbi:MAG: phospholipid carrier-dependent glycosyltransferase [Chloroflexi bacterium]|nr:phospholipid carrier-dependent glycosyltransferase [Chloroflexota bacterium]